MIIDIFTYGTASGGSELGTLIEAARRSHVDGIAVTDRGTSSQVRQYREVAAREGFLVLYGVELETSIGRVVGYPEKLDEDFLNESWRELGEIPSIESVLDYFHSRGGIVVARDVYLRDGGMKDRVYSAKDSVGRGFDGVDTLASYRRRIDNELSIEAQKVMGVGGCAGSGACEDANLVGSCATLFADSISDQAEFVAAMRGVLHWAVSLTDLGGACPMGTPPRYEDEDMRGGRREDWRGNRNGRGEERREGRRGSRDGRGGDRREERRGNRDGRGEERREERRGSREGRGEDRREGRRGNRRR